MKKLLGLLLVGSTLASSVAVAATPSMDKAMDFTRNAMMTKSQAGVELRQDVLLNKQQINDMKASKYVTKDALLFGQGQYQLVEKNYPMAIELFEEAITVNPKNSRALEGLAKAQLQRGDYVDALATVDKAIALDPINTSFIYTKADIQDNMGLELGALETYLTFTTMAPTDSRVIEVERRANDIFEKWQPRLSQSEMDYFTALRLLTFEHPEQAVVAFDSYIKESQTATPLNVNFPTLRSETLMNLTPEWVVNFFEKETPERVVRAHIFQAMAHLNLHQPEKAIALLNTAIKVDPATVKANTSESATATPQLPLLKTVAYYQLSNSYNQLGQKESAQTAWKKFIEYAPTSEATHLMNHPFHTEGHVNVEGTSHIHTN